MKRKKLPHRYSVNQMILKYQGFQKANFETVLITDVVNDLWRIKREKIIPREDL
jgi:hypothetical protein